MYNLGWCLEIRNLSTRCWLRARGSCRNCSTGCFCVPSPLSLLGIQVPLTSRSLEGFIGLPGWTPNLQDTEPSVDTNKDQILHQRQHLPPKELCLSPSVDSASPPAMWRAGRALVTGFLPDSWALSPWAVPSTLRFLVITLCDWERNKVRGATFWVFLTRQIRTSSYTSYLTIPHQLRETWWLESMHQNFQGCLFQEPELYLLLQCLLDFPPSQDPRLLSFHNLVLVLFPASLKRTPLMFYY